MTRLTPAERKLSQAFRDAVTALRADIADSPAVASALRVGNTEQLLAALDFDAFESRLRGAFHPILVDETITAGNAAFTPVTKATARLGWQLRHTQALSGRVYGKVGERITGIGSSIRESVRNAVGDAFTRTMTSRELAQVLGPMVGPNERDANTIGRAYLATRDDLLAQGIDVRAAHEQALALSERLSDQAVSRRGETIARTEIMTAQNDGRMESWKEAFASGFIDERAVKTWNAVDPCPICDELDGETVPFLEEFSSGDDMPPNHPNCKCSATLDAEPSTEPNADTPPEPGTSEYYDQYGTYPASEIATAGDLLGSGTPLEGLDTKFATDVQALVKDWTGPGNSIPEARDALAKNLELRDALTASQRDAPELYRAMRFSDPGEIDQFLNLRVGDVIENRSASSFTEDVFHALGFSGNMDSDSVLIHLNGRALPVAAISNTPDELEWMLFSNMRVTKIEDTVQRAIGPSFRDTHRIQVWVTND